MRHPELLRIASVKCQMSVTAIIANAMRGQRFCEPFQRIYDRYHYLDELPQFVEDYALKLLAENERKQKQLALAP